MTVKRRIKAFFNGYGYEASYRSIRRIEHLAGIQACLQRAEVKVVFDVGANKGQTILYLHPFFRNAHFYCFEPDPKTFHSLEQTVEGFDRVTALNLALGSADERRVLYANAASEGNSLLPVSSAIPQASAPGWLQRRGEEEVAVYSLDTFCREHKIESIDLLKLDTQGYEVQILKGAAELLREKAIKLIFTEVLFSEYYEKQAYFEDVYHILKCEGYKLVDLYQKFWGSDKALTACDALFIR